MKRYPKWDRDRDLSRWSEVQMTNRKSGHRGRNRVDESGFGNESILLDVRPLLPGYKRSILRNGKENALPPPVFDLCRYLCPLASRILSENSPSSFHLFFRETLIYEPSISIIIVKV